MTRLLVRLLPPDNPVDPESEAIDLFPPAPLRQFTIPCSKDETFSELWPRLEERIKSLYGSDLKFNIHKLQDSDFYDITTSDRIDLVYPFQRLHPSETVLHIRQLHPERESSIPVDSELKPRAHSPNVHTTRDLRSARITRPAQSSSALVPSTSTPMAPTASLPPGPTSNKIASAWSEEEISLLVALREEEHSYDTIAEALKRTREGVRKKLAKLSHENYARPKPNVKLGSSAAKGKGKALATPMRTGLRNWVQVQRERREEEETEGEEDEDETEQDPIRMSEDTADQDQNLQSTDTPIPQQQSKSHPPNSLKRKRVSIQQDTSGPSKVRRLETRSSTTTGRFLLVRNASDEIQEDYEDEEPSSRRRRSRRQKGREPLSQIRAVDEKAGSPDFEASQTSMGVLERMGLRPEAEGESEKENNARLNRFPEMGARSRKNEVEAGGENAAYEESGNDQESEEDQEGEPDNYVEVDGNNREMDVGDNGSEDESAEGSEQVKERENEEDGVINDEMVTEDISNDSEGSTPNDVSITNGAEENNLPATELSYSPSASSDSTDSSESESESSSDESDNSEDNSESDGESGDQKGSAGKQPSTNQSVAKSERSTAKPSQPTPPAKGLLAPWKSLLGSVVAKEEPGDDAPVNQRNGRRFFFPLD